MLSLFGNVFPPLLCHSVLSKRALKVQTSVGGKAKKCGAKQKSKEENIKNTYISLSLLILSKHSHWSWKQNLPLKKMENTGKNAQKSGEKQGKGLKVQKKEKKKQFRGFWQWDPSVSYVSLSLPLIHTTHRWKVLQPLRAFSLTKKKRMKNTYFWWLLQRPLLAPLKSYQRVEVLSSVREQSGEVAKGWGSQPLLLLLLLLFFPSCSFFLLVSGLWWNTK